MKNTRFAKASYTEIYDLQTDTSGPTVFSIHSPMSTLPIRAMSGFFNQFKQFKYTGCDVTLVPASTLPADPLQVSYEAGETTVDPRDMLNPILFKGAHGGDLGAALDSIVPVGTLSAASSGPIDDDFSVDGGPNRSLDLIHPELDSSTTLGYWENLYYTLLTDSSWKKSDVQSGVRMKCYPLVHRLIGNMQDLGNVVSSNSVYSQTGSVVTSTTQSDIYPNGSASSQSVDAAMHIGAVPDPADGLATSNNQYNGIYSIGWSKLGWLNTNDVFRSTTTGSMSYALQTGYQYVPQLPRIIMAVFMLPPAYKTEFYFRVVVKHKYLFKGYQSGLVANSSNVSTRTPYASRLYSTGESTASLESVSTNSIDSTSGVLELVSSVAADETDN